MLMVTFIVTILIVWLVLYLAVALFQIKNAQLTGVIIRGEIYRVASETELPSTLFEWAVSFGGGIAFVWLLAAYAISVEKTDSFLKTFLQPYLNPVPGNLEDAAITLSVVLLWLAAAFYVWLAYAESMTDRCRVRATVKLFGRDGKTINVWFTESFRNAWPEVLSQHLITPGTHVSWEGERIAVEVPPFDQPPLLYGIDDTKLLEEKE